MSGIAAAVIAGVGLAVSATTTGIGMANQAKASKQAMLAQQADQSARAQQEQDGMVAGMIDHMKQSSAASQQVSMELLQAMGYAMG